MKQTDKKKLAESYPLIAEMADYKEILWTNPDTVEDTDSPFHLKDIEEAEARLQRFAPYIRKAFPETARSGGIIESKLVEIPKMKPVLSQMHGPFPGRLFLKCDSHLPVSGSVKARGGIYEVLKFAESIAVDAGLLAPDDD